MIKYNTLEEVREAARRRAMKYYNKVKDTPEYKEKKRKAYLKRKNKTPKE